MQVPGAPTTPPPAQRSAVAARASAESQCRYHLCERRPRIDYRVLQRRTYTCNHQRQERCYRCADEYSHIERRLAGEDDAPAHVDLSPEYSGQEPREQQTEAPSD